MSELVYPENLEIDNVFISKLKCFIECPSKYYWTYVRGIQSKYLSFPLFVGSAYHHGLELLYLGKHSDDLILVEVNRFMDDYLKDYDIPDWQERSLEKQRGIALAMVKGYIAWIDRDDWDLPGADTHLNYKYVEQSFNYNPFLDSDSEMPYEGTIDLVGIDSRNRAWVIDHKAFGLLPENQKQILKTDMQLALYMDATKRVLEENVVGAIYNVVLKPAIRQRQSETPGEYLERCGDLYLEQPDKMFKRVLIEYTPQRVERMMTTIKHYTALMEAMHNEAETPNILGAGAIDAFPKNFSSCYKYGKTYGCPFRQLCEYARVGNSEEDMVQYTKNVRKERGNIIYG